jgi:hypothetical protein
MSDLTTIPRSRTPHEGNGRSAPWTARRFVASLAAVVALASVPSASAQDVGAARRDVTSAEDFRLRVSAALTLGRAKAEGSRELLERALADAHPSVRTAAAAALSALGDPKAVVALERAMKGETSPPAASQMKTALESLRAAGSDSGGTTAAPSLARTQPSTPPPAAWNGARYLVQVGTMRNASGTRGEDLAELLVRATHQHAGSLGNAVIAAADDRAALAQAARRKIPVVVLDGTLTRLEQRENAGQTVFEARVEYAVRRIPEHTLKAMLSGSARSFGSSRAGASPKASASLQEAAIDGAVQSALRGADSGIMVATR